MSDLPPNYSNLVLDLLKGREYALAMSPGFFRFYALIGCLRALEERGCLDATHVSGSSAGAIVGGFYAAGMTPLEMVNLIMDIRREDIWDAGLGLGLLKGDLLQALLELRLPVQRFEDCPKSLGVAAFQLTSLSTKIITTGNLATAIRASCCFPGLFSPVVIDGRRHIDGGIFDRAGLMGLPGIPSSKLIVNIVCDSMLASDSQIPDKFQGASLLTIVLNNIPDVSPLNMNETGPLAFEAARSAMLTALDSGNVQQEAYNHWILHLYGTSVENIRSKEDDDVINKKRKREEKKSDDIVNNKDGDSNISEVQSETSSKKEGKIASSES